jgi:hypothetical protein
MTYRQWLIIQSAMLTYEAALPSKAAYWEAGDGPLPTTEEVEQAMQDLSECVTVMAPEEKP